MSDDRIQKSLAGRYRLIACLTESSGITQAKSQVERPTLEETLTEIDCKELKDKGIDFRLKQKEISQRTSICHT